MLFKCPLSLKLNSRAFQGLQGVPRTLHSVCVLKESLPKPFLISSAPSSLLGGLSVTCSSSLTLPSLIDGDPGPDDGVGGSKKDLEKLELKGKMTKVLIFSTLQLNQGRSQGGPGVPVTPPPPFLCDS